jgi:hypothetical protein
LRTNHFRSKKVRSCRVAAGVRRVSPDNNLPNTGRNPTIADDTGLIVVKVPDVLEQD